MDAVNILGSITTTKITVLGTIIIILGIIAAITGIMAWTREDNLTGSISTVFLIILVIAFTKLAPVQKVNQYYIAFNDKVEFNEFYEKFTVIQRIDQNLYLVEQNKK